jgi:hypothetical protein
MTDATEFGVNDASDRLTPFWRRLVAVLEGLRDAAAVAPDPTPHTLCHTHQGTVLRHYRSKRPRPDSMPVLIVGGWLHRAELLDLGPNRSLIRALTERGMDVWMLDWNAASPLPTDWSVEECLTTVLLSTIDYVAGATANRPFGLLGVGEAGLLVLAAAARRLAGSAGVVIESGGAGDGSAWPCLVDLFQEADFAALVPRLPGMVTGLLEHGLLGIGEELIPAMEHLLAPYPVQSSSLACSIRWSLDRPDLPTRLLKEYREVSGGCGNWLAGRTGAAHPGSVSGQVQVLDLVGAHDVGRSVQPHAEPPAVIRSGGYEARTIPGPRSTAFMSATELSAVAAAIDLWFSSLG